MENLNNVVMGVSGDYNKIVNLSMTVNNDVSALFLKLKEKEKLIDKQNNYILILSKLVKNLWISRR